MKYFLLYLGILFALVMGGRLAKVGAEEEQTHSHQTQIARLQAQIRHQNQQITLLKEQLAIFAGENKIRPVFSPLVPANEEDLENQVLNGLVTVSLEEGFFGSTCERSAHYPASL